MSAEAASPDAHVASRPALRQPEAPGLARAVTWLLLYFGLPGLVMVVHPNREGAAGWATVVAAYLVATAMILLVAERALPPHLLKLSLARRVSVRGIALTLGLMPVAMSLHLAATSMVVRVMQPQDLGNDLWTRLFQTEGRVAAILATLVLVVVGPATEEIVFRGVLLTSFTRRYGPRAALVLSSLLFAVWHHPLAWAGTFVLGLVLGWWVQRTRTLAYTIGLHAAWNGLIGGLLPESVSADPGMLPLLAVLGLVIAGVLGLSALATIVRPPPVPSGDRT